MESRKPLPLLAFNHVSRVCTDLKASYLFYSEVLGFSPVKRPTSFEFEGAWLFNYGIGLHLIKGCPPARSSKIDPKACHISFQAISLEAVEQCLGERGIDYAKNVFVEDGIQVGQLFFHDPDNNMIEICNCDELPVVPLTEGTLACALRPLATAPPHAVVMPLHAAPSSDAGSDDSIQAAFDATRVDSDSSDGTDMTAGPSRRSRSLSFSSSSMSALTRAAEGFNMSICATDVGSWASQASGASRMMPGDHVSEHKRRLAH